MVAYVPSVFPGWKLLEAIPTQEVELLFSVDTNIGVFTVDIAGKLSFPVMKTPR
jgi:hypothetical protein